MKKKFNPEDLVFAVDIDGTLCEEEKDNFLRYEKVKPIKENIEKINLLSKKNTIIIYTSRYIEDREDTKKWLKKHGVSYHRLVMGKFKADHYIDNDSLRVDEIIIYRGKHEKSNI